MNRDCSNCEQKIINWINSREKYCDIFKFKPDYQLPCAFYIPSDLQLKKEKENK